MKPHHTGSGLNQFVCSEQVQSDFSMTGEEFVSRLFKITESWTFNQAVCVVFVSFEKDFPIQ